MITSIAKTKTCAECREDLLLASFYPHPGTRDRLQQICRVCMIKIKRSGTTNHGYAERHEAKRIQESEIAATLRTEEVETFPIRRTSLAELVSFEGQKTFSPRWRVA